MILETAAKSKQKHADQDVNPYPQDTYNHLGGNIFSRPTRPPVGHADARTWDSSEQTTPEQRSIQL